MLGPASSGGERYQVIPKTLWYLLVLPLIVDGQSTVTKTVGNSSALSYLDCQQAMSADCNLDAQASMSSRVRSLLALCHLCFAGLAK
jgi:hypothetical protein